MTSNNLGRLERVDLRDIWATEAKDFTPWLAKEENLAELAKTINMDLELEAQEKNVGPFRADILCKNTDDDSWVLIENQLERTDHTHLGQLLTYAAGLHAVTIAWISARFTDEHRATLDWLNEITDENFQFFGLEVELWRIADSLIAPKFNIVSKPNDWSRSVSQAARKISDEDLTGAKAQHLRYWTAFREFLSQRESHLRLRKPGPKHWTSFGIGRTGIHLTATSNTLEKRLGVQLYVGANDAKAFFHLLHDQKDKIENEVGSPLDWRELPDGKCSRIIMFKEECDPTDETDWMVQHTWLADTLEKFYVVFQDRVRGLNSEDWRPNET